MTHALVRIPLDNSKRALVLEVLHDEPSNRSMSAAALQSCANNCSSTPEEGEGRASRRKAGSCGSAIDEFKRNGRHGSGQETLPDVNSKLRLEAYPEQQDAAELAMTQCLDAHAGHDATRQSRAEPSRAEQNVAEQSTAQQRVAQQRSPAKQTEQGDLPTKRFSVLGVHLTRLLQLPEQLLDARLVVLGVQVHDDCVDHFVLSCCSCLCRLQY